MTDIDVSFVMTVYNKEYYYPKWSNGEKISVTNGVVINRYVDENTKDVYSCVEYYDNKNNRIEKWFQVDLENKQNFKVYYILDNPIEKSRLTTPHNTILIYGLPILIVLFVFIDIYIMIQIFKNKRKEKVQKYKK